MHFQRRPYRAFGFDDWQAIRSRSVACHRVSHHRRSNRDSRRERIPRPIRDPSRVTHYVGGELPASRPLDRSLHDLRSDRRRQRSEGGSRRNGMSGVDADHRRQAVRCSALAACLPVRALGTSPRSAWAAQRTSRGRPSGPAVYRTNGNELDLKAGRLDLFAVDQKAVGRAAAGAVPNRGSQPLDSHPPSAARLNPAGTSTLMRVPFGGRSPSRARPGLTSSVFSTSPLGKSPNSSPSS